jgi:serine/threonine protein kinase
MADKHPQSDPQPPAPTKKDEAPFDQVIFNASSLFDSPPGQVARKPGKRVGMPKKIGQYQIVTELGRGGMGVVYLARQPSLNRHVALKVLNINLAADPDDAARFKSEAKLAASLQHPNIVQIYEVGEQDGYAFMALEYIEGGTLHDFLSSHELGPRQAAALVEALAGAMQHAHGIGVIHRDLKPANILLSRAAERGSKLGEEKPASSDTRPPALGIAKITDFGLAKQMNQSIHLTATGIALGTPSYMAPEQAKDDRKNIGPISDVYSLGAILYECLTGKPPFSGKTPLITMQQVVKSRPSPPTEIRAGVPERLEQICLKCLEKNPKNRYPDAEALADALRRFLDGEAVNEQPVAALPKSSLILAILLGLSIVGNLVLFALWRSALR